MARHIKLSALNIAMHAPHSPEAYMDLFHRIYRNRRVVGIGGIHAAMIGSMGLTDDDDPLAGYSGEIYRFVRIDPNEPWFNTQTGHAATDSDVSRINIPDYLRPHLKTIPFVWDPRNHRLVFVSKDRKNNLSPFYAKKIFEDLVYPFVRDGIYPAIEITTIPDSDALERIFQIPVMKTLEIVLLRPNSDDGYDDEVRLMQILEDQAARKQVTQLIAKEGDSLRPNEVVRSMARVAEHNGHVKATGLDAGGNKVDESTANRPLVHSIVYDSNSETLFGVLRRTALQFFGSV